MEKCKTHIASEYRASIVHGEGNGICRLMQPSNNLVNVCEDGQRQSTNQAAREDPSSIGLAPPFSQLSVRVSFTEDSILLIDSPEYLNVV